MALMVSEEKLRAILENLMFTIAVDKVAHDPQERKEWCDWVIEKCKENP